MLSTAHRNGIPKPKSNRYASMKGVDPKASVPDLSLGFHQPKE
jgi:hypothetical protein